MSALGPTARWPDWLEEIELALPICSQFVVHGNVRDQQMAPMNDGLALMRPIEALWERLRPHGFDFFLVFDRTDGLRAHPAEASERAVRVLQKDLPWLRLAPGREPPAEERAASRLAEVIRAVQAGPVRCALIVENASRLITNLLNIHDNEVALFASAERLALLAAPLPTAGGRHTFNPVFWMINRPRDLPDWFAIGNDRIRNVAISEPDYETRLALAGRLARTVEPTLGMGSLAAAALVKQFADRTEGLTLRGIDAVAMIARDRRIPLAQIADAVRCYKVGLPRDPWSEPHLRERIKKGREDLAEQVLGQDRAINKTRDVLIRSILGLSGAQSTSTINRPRGVLFFAGSTGVGKTELARAISRLIFGDVDAYVRFDMSEFTAEHSDARLIGAPPGYVGYDVGGELVNAIRQRPFSVLLFDEIEKAHPRILDKFLQIIEDGRLTDGRGDTVYFSDAVIVFTSNLGVYKQESGRRVWNISPEQPYERVEEGIRTAIQDHFRFNLQRPELLNRIGKNIVVFDFIRPPVARLIFKKAIANVLTRVREAQHVEVALSDATREQLLRICTSDLMDGARGINNMLEAAFINPLARALFELNPERGATVHVNQLVEEGGGDFSVRATCASG